MTVFDTNLLCHLSEKLKVLKCSVPTMRFDQVVDRIYNSRGDPETSTIERPTKVFNR